MAAPKGGHFAVKTISELLLVAIERLHAADGRGDGGQRAHGLEDENAIVEVLVAGCAARAGLIPAQEEFAGILPAAREHEHVRKSTDIAVVLREGRAVRYREIKTEIGRVDAAERGLREKITIRIKPVHGH